MRDNAEITLAAGQTALLIIDVQKGLFEGDDAPHDALGVVHRINACSEVFRQAKAPVFLIQHDGSEEDGVAPFTEGWHFHPRLHTLPKDIVVRKTTCDAFYRTLLEKELRERGIQELVVCGYATEYCVEATVRTACSRDYKVWVVADAHTTNHSPILQAAQIIAHHNHTWPECTAKKPIQLIGSKELTTNLAMV